MGRNRNRNIIIAAAVAAALLVGFFATRSNGSDGDGVQTTAAKNCAPVARLDAAATTQGAAVAVDVLANDTDPDGDPLTFQILKTTGGTATVDDGATPTDASDDRVMFTPAVPAPPAAVVEYQAVDPRGAVDASTIEVSINELGALPPGVQSETVSSEDTVAGECDDAGPNTTEVTDTTFPAEPTPTTYPFEAEDFDTTDTTRRSSSGSSGGSSSKKTTTTTKNTTTTKPSGGGSNTTQPTSPQPTSPPTTSPSTTQPGPTTTTTSPFQRCGQNPGYGNPGFDEWVECMND